MHLETFNLYSHSHQLFMNQIEWLIKDQNTGMYFSLLGSPHFTGNREIAQRFTSEADAVKCEENHIHCNTEFDEYDTMPVVDTSSFIKTCIDSSNLGYEMMYDITMNSALVEEAEASIEALIESLTRVRDSIKALQLDGETKLD